MSDVKHQLLVTAYKAASAGQSLLECDTHTADTIRAARKQLSTAVSALNELEQRLMGLEPKIGG